MRGMHLTHGDQSASVSQFMRSYELFLAAGLATDANFKAMSVAMSSSLQMPIVTLPYISQRMSFSAGAVPHHIKPVTCT